MEVTPLIKFGMVCVAIFNVYPNWFAHAICRNQYCKQEDQNVGPFISFKWKYTGVYVIKPCV